MPDWNRTSIWGASGFLLHDDLRRGTSAGMTFGSKLMQSALLRPWSHSPWAEAFMIVGSIAGLSAVSWIRVAFVGTLKVDDVAMSNLAWVVSSAAFGLTWLPAGWAIVRLAIHGVYGLSLRTILKLALVIHGIALTAAPLTSNDAFNYLAYGRLWHLDHNPCLQAPAALDPADPFRMMVGSMWLNEVTAYGPVLTLLNIAAAAAGSVVGGLIILKVAMLAAVLATIAIAARMASTTETADRSGLALLSCNPLLAWEVVGQLHSDGVVVLCAVLFLALARSRYVAAILVLAIGCCAKFVLLPAAGFYLAWLARQDLSKAVIASAAFVAGTALVFLPFWAGAETLRGPLLAMNPGPSRVTGSLVMLIEAALSGLGSNVVTAAYCVWTWSARASIGVLGAVAMHRARDLDDVRRGTLVLTILLLSLGTGWILPWYGVWLLPWSLGEKSPRLRLAVVVYTALLPVLYAPDAIERATVLFTLAVHLVPTLFLWSWWRQETTIGTQPSRTTVL